MNKVMLAGGRAASGSPLADADQENCAERVNAVVSNPAPHERSRVADFPTESNLAMDRTGLFHPYVLVLLCESLVTASEVLLKLGARETANLPPFFPALQWIGASGLQSKWVWLAIPCMIASFVAWLWVIRALPLNVASMLASVVHIMVPLSCLLILGEHISARRWCGIALVLAGLVLVAAPRTATERLPVFPS